MNRSEAIVLVGGLGTRLRPVVSDVPKPLASVGGRPFLAYMLDSLERAGIRRVILAAGYKSDVVRHTIGERWHGMCVDYSIEDAPLGTGGAIAKALTMLDADRAHVLNGDTYLRYDLAAFADASLENGFEIGMALAHVADVARYGAVEREGRAVSGFAEKGRSGEGFINAGCYFLTAAAIATFPVTGRFSFESDVLPGCVAARKVFAYPETDDFIDIGIPEDFARAQDVFGGRS